MSCFVVLLRVDRQFTDVRGRRASRDCPYSTGLLPFSRTCVTVVAVLVMIRTAISAPKIVLPLECRNTNSTARALFLSWNFLPARCA